MITLYRPEECSVCDQVEETLQDLCLAHRVVSMVASAEAPDGFPGGATLPVLVDDETVAEGKTRVLEQLQKLEMLEARWDKYQSDSCYCDDEGNVQ